jgi:hypothetical protein
VAVGFGWMPFTLYDTAQGLVTKQQWERPRIAGAVEESAGE